MHCTGGLGTGLPLQPCSPDTVFGFSAAARRASSEDDSFGLQFTTPDSKLAAAAPPALAVGRAPAAAAAAAAAGWAMAPGGASAAASSILTPPGPQVRVLSIQVPITISSNLTDATSFIQRSCSSQCLYLYLYLHFWDGSVARVKYC